MWSRSCVFSVDTSGLGTPIESLAHDQGGAKKDRLPGTQLQRLSPLGRTGLESPIELGDLTLLVRPTPQHPPTPADEVSSLRVSLQLRFCTTLSSSTPATPTGFLSLPPASSSPWLAADSQSSTLVQQCKLLLSEKRCFPQDH